MANKTNPRVPQETIDAIVVMWNKGMSSTQIGIRLHRSRNSIIGLVHRAKEKGAEVRVYEGSSKPSKPRKPRKRSRPVPKPVKTGPTLADRAWATMPPPALEILVRDAPTASDFGTFTIVNVPNAGCRYSSSESRPMLFCGKPGFPWCDEHRKIVFINKGE